MINPTMGTVTKTVGLHVEKTRKSRSRKGKGIVCDLLGMINTTIGTVAETVGLGIKKLENQEQGKEKLLYLIWQNQDLKQLHQY